MAEPNLAEPKVAEAIPLPRPRPDVPAWSEPRSFREAAGPDFKSAEVTSEPSDCRLRLEQIAALAPMPRLIGPGACGGADMVRLDAVLGVGGERVEIKPAPVLRCAMAESLAAWVRDEAVPLMAKTGTALKSVDTYDDFSCRGRNRVFGAKLSEHGKGNAVDVRTFTLADRRVIRLTDIAVEKDLRAGLRASACGRFTTVLGPGSDGYHEEHIHLDLADRRNGYRMCQWDVREPPPPLPPKAPEAKVAAAPATSQTDVASAPAKASAAVGRAAENAAIADPPDLKVADMAVPLPVPRPPQTGKIRHERRKTRRDFHFPFTLWR